MAKTVKVNGEEFEVEEEVHPTARHFSQSMNEIELSKKLARYREIQTEIEALEALKDSLRQEFIQLGKGEEFIKAGDHVCYFKQVKGRESFQWKEWATKLCGKPTEADLKEFTKHGEDSVRIEVRRM